MTIYFFTGTPGSGKTYEAVEKILNNLRMGKCVYTNIDGMDHPHCQETLKVLAGLDDLQFARQFHHLGNKREVIENFWDYCPERNSLIVLDEVQKYFSNRDWKELKNRAFSDWASTHRHEGYDLVIITQNAERIDSAVRGLTEWNYQFRKINFFGSMIQKGYLRNVYPGEDTAGKPMKRETRRYNSKIFACYKSYAASDIKEQSIMPNVNILQHPVFFAIPLVLCFTIYMIFFKSSFATGDIFGTKKIQQKALAAINTSEAKASSLPPSPDHSQGFFVDSIFKPAPGISASPSPQLTPIIAQTTDQPAADPAPVPVLPQTHRVKLNYVEISKGDKTAYRILYGGEVHTMSSFPFPISIENGRFYADIPVENNPDQVASLPNQSP